jgi:tetratricopeptide (TPR) repeat protein
MADRTTAAGRGDAVAAAAVFLLALALRLSYLRDLVRAGLADFLRLDPLYYHEWGVRIARGDWLGRDAFEMSPLYPYLLGAVYKLAGVSLVTPRVLQAVLGAATCAATALLGSRLFGRTAGALAGAMLAAYGPALFYDGQINKTTAALALSVAFAGALTVSGGRRPGWIAASGAALGLAALVHENVNVAAPAALAWIAWPRPGEPRRPRLGPAVAFLAGYAAVVLPVTGRNVAVAGELVLITSGGGENFYTGNHENASGRYAPPPFVRPDPFLEHEDFRREAARRLGRPVTRGEASRYWWGEGLRFIAGNPGKYARLLWDKLGVFLNAFERPDNFSYYNFRVFSPTLGLPLLSFGIVAPLAAAGIAASAARWRELIPVYAAGGAYLVSALIFFTQSRYRMPAVPFLALFAAHGLLSLVASLRERRLGAAGALAAWAAAAFLFVNRDPGNAPAFHAQNDAILGEMYLHAGRADDAAASFRRGVEALAPMAESGDPVLVRILGAARHGLGVSERSRGDAAAAERALREAAACPDPDVRADALLELAEILKEKGDAAGRASALGEAASLRPADFELRIRHAEALYALGRLDEALLEIRAALSIDPPPSRAAQARAWYGAGLVHAAAGDPRAAREAFDRTLRLDPNHPRAAWIRRLLAGSEPPAP